jgi:hypothetical protein
MAFILTSCGPTVKVTTWKNPAIKSKISKVAILPLFKKVEFIKAFEVSMVSCFDKKGLKAIGSLDFLNPTVRYPIDEIKHRCDSLGVDAILIVLYQGTDKTESYVPPTNYYSGGYGGFGGYWDGGYWGGASGNVSTEGYWTTSHVINLTAKLYVKGNPDAIWTSEISVTDPEYVDVIANNIGKQVYADWQKNQILKFDPARK